MSLAAVYSRVRSTPLTSVVSAFVFDDKVVTNGTALCEIDTSGQRKLVLGRYTHFCRRRIGFLGIILTSMWLGDELHLAVMMHNLERTSVFEVIRLSLAVLAA
jgi:hypothetical protein